MSAQRYAALPGRAWSPCACVITARPTGCHGSMWNSPAGQYSPAAVSTSISRSMSLDGVAGSPEDAEDAE